MGYIEFFDEVQIKKSFNTTGICNEKKHYMVNINSKLKQIVKLVQEEKYFVINKPRQYGKTTTLNKLDKILRSRYIVIKMNFEGMESEFEKEERFCIRLIEAFEVELKVELEKVDSIYLLSKLIQ
ncbi:MAG: AAA family ATPase, partial [Clostridium sp.]